MTNKIKNLKSEDIRTDNANLYLVGDGEFYDLGKELKTLREGDVCYAIVSKLKKHKYSYPHDIKTFKDLLNLLGDMDEEDKRKMDLQKDIIKVGTVKNTDEGQCPHCGSGDIDWGALEVDTFSDQIYYKCTCNECGEHFYVWYKPVYIETLKD